MDRYQMTISTHRRYSSCMFRSTRGCPPGVERKHGLYIVVDRKEFDTWGMSWMYVSIVRDTECGRRVHTRASEWSVQTCPRDILGTEVIGRRGANTSCDSLARFAGIVPPYACWPCTSPSSCSTRRGKIARGLRVRKTWTSCWSDLTASRYLTRMLSSIRFLKRMSGSVSCSVRHVGHSSDVSNQVMIHAV